MHLSLQMSKLPKSIKDSIIQSQRKYMSTSVLSDVIPSLKEAIPYDSEIFTGSFFFIIAFMISSHLFFFQIFIILPLIQANPNSKPFVGRWDSRAKNNYFTYSHIFFTFCDNIFILYPFCLTIICLVIWCKRVFNELPLKGTTNACQSATGGRGESRRSDFPPSDDFFVSIKNDWSRNWSLQK